MALGKKTGGRLKGSVNKSTAYRRSSNDPDFDPFAIMRALARGELKCRVCHGVGKTKFQPRHGRALIVRVCESCWGAGKEQIAPELSGKMASELAQYQAPKLRAIEHTGPLGGPIEVELNLKALTDEELELAHALALKAQPGSVSPK